ncbi:copper chaperone for superoxide dismutase-like [Physella acuta]|uniref:copper chaperone for superoxide dismutase-like n=1 Tax=Physella acuta TaxID=109671 RepID=UPI0027DEA75D|nr:copper chaperone for superoxide dismutase-like [Physella acuta]XP_059176432.1 copper chaperone for superoxide dismutase-like [Physella acuta]XP_059176433.1 copper chaperone for superoxide dismutase-like [Physella acuta]
MDEADVLKSTESPSVCPSGCKPNSFLNSSPKSNLSQSMTMCPGLKDTTVKMEFAVEMNSACCAGKVKTALLGLDGVSSVDVDVAAQRLVVEGNIAAESVKNTIETKTGMSAVLLGHGINTQQSLGAGVAALNIGSCGVQGLLRFVQTDTDSCLIEGTVDQLPTAEPVFLTVHQTGDVTSGCDSCGTLFTSSSFQGILSQLHPQENQTADFRLVAQNVKLSEIIGHCVVVHQGDEKKIELNQSKRLACGIVARASGLFENSKRFCACDGITIWEQRHKDTDSRKL